MLSVLLLLSACTRAPYRPADARRPAAAGPLPAGTDSVHNAAAGRHYNQHGGLYKAVFGRHYRAVWAAPVAAPVLNLAHAAPGGGPLALGKLGGGFQSISLTLRDSTGREFALRALDKDPRKTLPTWLRRTFLLKLVRDATSAGNPYAALTVPPLAEAVGVVPAHPRLVYVAPHETGLGELSGRLQGQLALLEEKYDGPADRAGVLRRAQAFLNSEELLGRVYADPRQRIDQQAFLRARLLDVWLGDWDRHERQWQWAAFGQKSGFFRYLPLPKDRDQVFFRFDDGVLPWLVSRLVPKLQTFGPRYGSVRGLVKQATFIDQRGLPACSRADFQRAAAALQAQLPDSLIDRALHRLPPTVYSLVGPGTAAALRARRAALPAAARQFYRALARQPVLAGTAGAERFVVQRTADSVVVRIFSPALGADSLWFRRAFFASETTKITLDGLGGDDVFEVHTDARRRAGRLRLSLIGGAGTDQVRGTGTARRLRYYDQQELGATRPAPPKSGFLGRPRPGPRHYRPYNRLADE